VTIGRRRSNAYRANSGPGRCGHASGNDRYLRTPDGSSRRNLPLQVAALDASMGGYRSYTRRWGKARFLQDTCHSIAGHGRQSNGKCGGKGDGYSNSFIALISAP
jgi:hypothetical protein